MIPFRPLHTCGKSSEKFSWCFLTCVLELIESIGYSRITLTVFVWDTCGITIVVGLCPLMIMRQRLHCILDPHWKGDAILDILIAPLQSAAFHLLP